jgi:hypothetical protein
VTFGSKDAPGIFLSGPAPLGRPAVQRWPLFEFAVRRGATLFFKFIVVGMSFAPTVFETLPTKINLSRIKTSSP